MLNCAINSECTLSIEPTSWYAIVFDVKFQLPFWSSSVYTSNYMTIYEADEYKSHKTSNMTLHISQMVYPKEA